MQNHFNRPLSQSPVQKWSNNKIVKAKMRLTVTFTMTNGGIHYKGYKPRTIRRADILLTLDYAEKNCCLQDYLFIRLPIKAGLRTNEICTLLAQFIDFASCHFKVYDSKKYMLYPLPLDIKTVELIKKLLDGRQEGYVFSHWGSWQNARKDKPLTRGYIWQVVKRIGVEAGVDGLKPRDLRDFFAAYWFYVKHGNLEILRQIMRHSDIRMTDRYVRSMVFEEDVDREYRRVMDPLASNFMNNCSVCDDCLSKLVCGKRDLMPEFATGCRFKQKQKEELKI
jgi:integrase